MLRVRKVTNITPQIISQSRFYDRKRYLKEKRQEAKQNSLENIKLSQSFDLLSQYSLGITTQIKAQFTLRLERAIRGQVLLPNQAPSASTDKVLVFCQGEDMEIAKKLGATYVGSDDLIQDVIDGKIQFDRALSARNVFPKVIKIARILGPLGANALASQSTDLLGSVSDDIAQMMTALNQSTKFESTPENTVEVAIGTSDKLDEMESNLKAIYKAILDLKPSKIEQDRFVESLCVYGDFTPAVELAKRPFRSLK